MSQICTLFKNEFDKAAKELNVAPRIVNTIYELVLKELNPTLSDNVELPTKQQFIDSINKYYNFNYFILKLFQFLYLCVTYYIKSQLFFTFSQNYP